MQHRLVPLSQCELLELDQVFWDSEAVKHQPNVRVILHALYFYLATCYIATEKEKEDALLPTLHLCFASPFSVLPLQSSSPYQSQLATGMPLLPLI